MAYSYDLRIRVLSHIKHGGSRMEACRLFGIDRKTVYNWLKSPTLSPVKIKQTRKCKLDKQLLSQHIRQFPDAILKERAAIFGVTPSGVWRSLNNLNIVKKND